MEASFKIQPILDKVIVRRVETLEKIGSLFVPDQAKLVAAEGYVVACGTGKETEKGFVYPMHVKVGDRVIFERGVCTEIKVDGVEYVMIRQEHVLGIIDDSDGTSTFEVLPPVRNLEPLPNAPKFG